MASFAVAGSGYNAIAFSQVLIRKKHDVVIVDKSREIGGVLLSPERDGLFLDNGCHLFDNSDRETAQDALEILGDDVLPVAVAYASVTEGRQTAGIAIPDFSAAEPGRRAAMLEELIAAAVRDSGAAAPAQHLHDLLRARFGATLGDALGQAVKKLTLAEATELDSSMLARMLMSRVRLLPDQEASLLKRLPEFACRLAVPAGDNPLRFYPDALQEAPRNFYPKAKGMRGFCEAAERYLRRHGATIRLSNRISAVRAGTGSVGIEIEAGRGIDADYLVWTSDLGYLAEMLYGRDPLSGFKLALPMVLYYFLIPISEPPAFTYIQDFTPATHIFRASSPGFYGAQRTGDGMSYLCAEVPASMGCALWESPQRFEQAIWKEMVNLGMTGFDAPVRTIIRKAPVSVPLFRPGYGRARAELATRIAADHPRILLADVDSFSKNEIAASARRCLAEV